MISLSKAFNVTSEIWGKKSMNDYPLGEMPSSGNLFSLVYGFAPILVLMRLYFQLLGNIHDLSNEETDLNSYPLLKNH